jgi:hypothetical protein
MNRQSLLTRYRPLVVILTIALAVAAFTTAPAAADIAIEEEAGGEKQCERICSSWDINRGYYNCKTCCVKDGVFLGCS